jgi:hypothetical protein
MNGNFDPTKRTTKFTEADQGDVPTIGDEEQKRGGLTLGPPKRNAAAEGIIEGYEQQRKRQSAKRY